MLATVSHSLTFRQHFIAVRNPGKIHPVSPNLVALFDAQKVSLRVKFQCENSPNVAKPCLSSGSFILPWKWGQQSWHPHTRAGVMILTAGVRGVKCCPLSTAASFHQNLQEWVLYHLPSQQPQCFPESMEERTGILVERDSRSYWWENQPRRISQYCYRVGK